MMMALVTTCAWLRDHEFGVTLLVLIFSVPWYIRINVKRRGDCEPQFWFMFSLNVVGVVTGAYVFLSALAATLGKSPANDQNTFMAAFGGFAVVAFTVNNIRKELNELFQHEVQPSRKEPDSKLPAS
ncbi:MAG: hypothetical protein ACLQOO_19815 [Terriglobia bacterium]